MSAAYDKVIITRENDSDEIKSITIHDTKNHKKLIGRFVELSMDELVDLFNDNEKSIAKTDGVL